MSFDFPASPAENQEFTPAGAGVTYRFTNPIWTPVSGGGGAGGVPEAPNDGKQYARQNVAWSEVATTVTWASLSGKPATFPPTLPIASSGVTGLDTKQASQDTAIGTKLDANSYTAADVLTKLKTVDGALSALDADLLDGQEGTYYLDYTNVINKPTTFAPSAHVHPQSDVTGLVTALSGKEPTISGGTTSQFWRGDKTWAVPPVGITGFAMPGQVAIWTDPGEIGGNANITVSNGKLHITDPTSDLHAATKLYVDNATATKEPTISGGTITQYWRGDKSWQTLPPPGISDATSDGKQYARQDASWVEVNIPPTTYIGDFPPSSPAIGQLWWNTEVGDLFIRFDDGNSEQWVPATVSQPGPPGPAGPPAQWVQLTQAAYDALSPPDANTLYIVIG